MRRLSQIAADCGGQLIGEDSPWSSASIDTRRIAAGELFIALRGPNFDGADFLGAAAAAGAAAAGRGCARRLNGRRCATWFPRSATWPTCSSLSCWPRRLDGGC